MEHLYIAGANVDAKDDDENNAIHLAAAKGWEEVVTKLLESKASVDDQNKFGNTPLHLAAKEGHSSVVQILLNGGANPNMENQDGDTPLQSALKKGHLQVAEIISHKTGNMKEMPLLHWAIKEGHLKIVELLLAKEEVDVTAKNEDGQTPMSLASKNGKHSVVQYLKSKGVMN